MKNFVSLVKTLVVGVALAFGVCAAEAQTPAYYAGDAQYLSGGLLATNFALIGSASFTTNLVAANYFFPANPNTVGMGNGVFLVSPAASLITLQANFEQYSNQTTGFVLTNAIPPGSASNTVVINALIQPILDDVSLKYGGLTTLTNNTMFSVPMTIPLVSTNIGGALATASFSSTNMVGAKYGKLIGFYGSMTNLVYFQQGLRFGEWAPAK